MVKADLITGFLGSGKTTFIRSYVSALAEQGERICILENDYGAINVDMMLLSDLKEKGIGLEMVAGGCDSDCHRRRFRTKLITMAMLGYERVIIEPSGVFDVDEFFEILHEEPLDVRYEIANVLTIVNARLEEQFSAEADYMLASQAAHAGRIILSHVQEATPEDVQNTISHINRALEMFRCARRFSLEDSVIARSWGDFTEEDFRTIASSGYQEFAFEKSFSMDHNRFSSLFFMNVSLPAEELCNRIPSVFLDQKAGLVLRIKGFFREWKDGRPLWVQINATREGMQRQYIQEGQEVLIIIGEDLNETVLSGYFPSKHSTASVNSQAVLMAKERGKEKADT